MVAKNWETDERRYNKRGGPSSSHKVRVIVGTNKNPIAYGITLPKHIVDNFSGCKLEINISGGAIIMEKVDYENMKENLE